WVSARYFTRVLRSSAAIWTPWATTILWMVMSQPSGVRRDSSIRLRPLPSTGRWQLMHLLSSSAFASASEAAWVRLGATVAATNSAGGRRRVTHAVCARIVGSVVLVSEG